MIMKLKMSRRDATRRLEFLDAVMDSYLHWRQESRAVAASYRSWRSANRGERGDAFHDYLDALDREERAAHAYRLAEQVPAR